MLLLMKMPPVVASAFSVSVVFADQDTGAETVMLPASEPAPLVNIVTFVEERYAARVELLMFAPELRGVTVHGSPATLTVIPLLLEEEMVTL